ncbi:chitinase [Mucor ambiguus]|uniref:chitinase n=1 Tax=Mucor ambiguus TaxID=91626 RepID=A0A0C9M2N7_9FUNG|nr:chitinase [Mucor ambiguus]
MYAFTIFLLTLAFSRVQCAFNATANTNIIYYWGQNSASVAPNDPNHSLWQKRLSYYCDGNDKDIIVVSFLHQFGMSVYRQGRSTAFDLSNSSQDCKGLIPGTQLLNCPNMEEDIIYCQSKGIKILLSMGGATPAYGVATVKEGEDLADELWDTFGGGYQRNATAYRPFGNATVDGFDLDIENGEKLGYTAFVNKMRQNYELDTSKSYYIAAAPQCPFPDYFVGDTLNHAWFDFVMIQFYNNFCSVIYDNNFNYNIWDAWASAKSMNKDVRLFVGIPGSPSAAGRGYVPYTQLVSQIQPLKSMNSFGGIMVWDASQAYGNTQDVLPDYAHGIYRLIKDTNDTSPIELAPIIMNTTRVMPSSTTTEVILPPSTSVLPIITTTSSTATELITPSVDCIVENVTSNIMWTSTIESNSTQSESVASSVQILPITSCHNATTTFATITSTVTLLPTTSPAASSDVVSLTTMFPTLPLPIAGDACEKDGVFMCSGEFSFAQCVFGQWISRNCTTGTICRESYDTNPPSIYCGFP